jgi:acyl-CoA thioesterase
MPEVAGPEGLLSVEERLARLGQTEDGPYHQFWSNFESRPLQWIDNWEEREPGEPHFSSWYRYVPSDTFDDPFVDAGRALLLVDTLGWPAATRAYAPTEMAFYAPSIDVSCQFHALAPDDPWLLAEARSPLARDGLVGASMRIWSSGGRLLASGGQQMMCRPMNLQTQ